VHARQSFDEDDGHDESLSLDGSASFPSLAGPPLPLAGLSPAQPFSHGRARQRLSPLESSQASLASLDESMSPNALNNAMRGGFDESVELPHR
jgi:hypothetical protein